MRKLGIKSIVIPIRKKMSGQILTDAGSLPGHFLTDEDLCPGHFITDQDFWMSLPETVRKYPDIYKYKGFKAWCAGCLLGACCMLAACLPRACCVLVWCLLGS